ncbi:Ribosomal L34e protein [Rutstroemia sp. NJR-2017a WRK4]|nr:Ribosomal L34e protein [Rutstroemia sp. NJR-2017a WRK4]
MAAGQQVVPIMTGQTESNAPGTEQQAPAPEADEDVWDEERLDQAMKTLKEMHIQASHIESTYPRQKLTRFPLKLRNLRTTIPRLIAPLTTKQPSPDVLFTAFSTSARTANQEVHDFKRLMKDEQSVKIFEHAKKSRAENPHGIKPWRVTEHPDWLDGDA